MREWHVAGSACRVPRRNRGRLQERSTQRTQRYAKENKNKRNMTGPQHSEGNIHRFPISDFPLTAIELLCVLSCFSSVPSASTLSAPAIGRLVSAAAFTFLCVLC